ncbi:MAG: hypothetical protein JSS61_01255 [Verrucomicrobia bacterium]|nr:hypothetical protein [Verrucomicrobiota bacterium]
MDSLKVYIDRLKNEELFAIEETLPPEFMELQEAGLQFKKPIQVKGDAYLANDHLVIQLHLHTEVFLPCSICNEFVSYPIEIHNLSITQPLEDIKKSVYDLSGEIRESILLQVPPFVECGGGNCPEREKLKEFLKRPEGSDIIHYPFAEL